MAPPRFSDYLKKEGSQVKNLQTLLNYYGELYQFYSDKLPNNKYIDYLEENLYKDGFSTMPPAVRSFVSLRPDQLSLLTCYVRFYKVFQFKNGSTKKLEIPFENKTDFSSFEDPQKYIGTPFVFASQRFMGPIALLEDISISEGSPTGRGATAGTTDWAKVSMGVRLQDAKMLFKNFGTKKLPIFYKDFFSAPVSDKSRGIVGTFLKLEIGYNVPDDADNDLKLIAQTKSCYDLFPTGLASSLTFDEDGSLTFKSDLTARFKVQRGDINILDQKYYKQVRKANNMLVVEDSEKVSVEEYDKKRDLVSDEKTASVEKDLKAKATKTNKKPSSKDPFIESKEAADNQRLATQLASSTGAIPPTFSFITALYEAGLIYYFEIDNDTYKDYIQKIAKNEPVDVSNISFLPTRKKKTRLNPIDTIRSNPGKADYFANTLNIKKFNTDEEEPTSYERIKFFYFGDLVDIMLNNTKGTGVGQDLDNMGGVNQFSYLFGPILWIKDQKTKIAFNILNTPISLDMFMFEINREVYQKRRQRISLDEFFSIFMKKFFDVTVLAYEKNVSGKFIQEYFGNTSYVLDKDKYDAGSKFKQKLFNLIPTVDTVETKSASLITTMPIQSRISKQKLKQRNIPTFYVGGPDKGPLQRINFQISPDGKRAEYEYDRRLRGKVQTVESIDDPFSNGFFVTYFTRISLTLKGSAFFKLSDFIFIDSRFVDGGFFLQEQNKVYFTGFYRISSIRHRIDESGDWKTSIEAIWQCGPEPDNDSYNSYSGELPKVQSVNISDEANINRQNIVTEASNVKSTADKKSMDISKSTADKPNTDDATKPLAVPKE